MIREIIIDGQKHSISPSDILGVGGEATVLQVGKFAAKIYHKAKTNKTNELRIEKVQDLIKFNPNLPTNVLRPIKAVYDAKGKHAIGYIMQKLPPYTDVIQQLSSKSFRKLYPHLNLGHICEIFGTIHRTTASIHSMSMVVGDFNDMNIWFSVNGAPDSIFSDVDSFQFGRFPCMVGTETYLVPELYGKDLSVKPLFLPEHDWYSFWCMFIKSLTLAHPYGGFHPVHRTIPQRALARITIFDSVVKYPKAALNHQVLNDDLIAITERICKQGERFKPDLGAIQSYHDSLVTCKSCGIQHPSERRTCPQCATINTQQIKRKVQSVEISNKRVQCEELLTTSGNFIWFDLYQNQLFAISKEKNSLFLHHRDYHTKSAPKAFSQQGTYRLFGGRFLCVGHNNDIIIYDLLTPSSPVLVGAGTFKGDAVFTCTKDYIVRVQNAFLYKMQYNSKLKLLQDEKVLSVMDKQTWITGSSSSSTCLGFQRFFHNLNFYLWKFNPDQQTQINMPAFDDNESIIGVEATFSPTSGHDILCLVETEIKGRTYVHVCVVQSDGSLAYHDKVERLSSDLYRSIRGKCFVRPPGTNGMVLHPTDDGIVQELIGVRQTLMSETEQFVSESDSLYMYRNGVLVVGDNSINLLTM